MIKLKSLNFPLTFSILLFALFIIYTSCKKDVKQKEDQLPKLKFTSDAVLPDDQFVGEKTCQECHSDAYEAWKGSHHDLAMQVANEMTILGDFNNTTYTTKEGMKSRFYQKDGKFWVNTEGDDGKYYDWEIIYTYGLTPLQQYIIEFPKGKFQCLSTAWDTEEKKWFDLQPNLDLAHTEWLHQSRGGSNWNTMCSDCHSTNVRKNYNEREDAFDTQFSLLNVSCEACHGPGKEHVELARKGGENYTYDYENENFLMTRKTYPKEMVDQCARCHVRREQITLAYNYEGTLLDHYNPQLLTEGHYHPDGQILDEVYVYGSFVQSKMYMNNVRCVDCHDPHSMELKLAGNALCTQCHEPKEFDTELHTFHAVNTEGSQCINCHMTGQLYMVNDYRRDHSFRIPRPDLSIKYGSPNACNQCHTDKKAEWAWEAYKGWYGTPDSLHYTDVLAMGQSGEANAFELLNLLAHNAQEPPIVRATAANYIGRYANEASVKSIISLFSDKNELVRSGSVDALGRSQDISTSATYLIPLLEDEKRAVRVKAFKWLAGYPENQIPAKYQSAYQQVKKEFYNYLKTISDFPGGQSQKALYMERTGDRQGAIQAYERAIAFDSYNNTSRNNLANLYYQTGQYDKAEVLFKKIIEQEPDFGPTYYSLGLLYAEMKRTDEAIEALELASQKYAGNPRVFYNLSLLYQEKQSLSQAEDTLLKGLSIHPSNESLLYLATYFYLAVQADGDKARKFAKQLVSVNPTNRDYQQMYQNAQAM